jgi:hypothetical protein
MKSMLIVSLTALLVFAPAAAAKGPHVVLTTPGESVEPGKPWEFTVELNEFPDRPHVAVTGRLGSRTVGGRVERTPSSMTGAAGYRITMVFPDAGRWTLRLFAGAKRFAFPAVDVGGTTVPQDYIAFPIGSDIPGQITNFSPSDAPEPAPAEAATKTETASADDGGIGPWALPLLGVVLAGAGVAAVSRRGWR